MLDCTKYHPRSEHRRLCEQGLLLPTGRMNPAVRLKRKPCIHLLPQTGESRDCKTCTGSVRIKLHGCALHGQCATDKVLPGVKCCRICPDYQAVENDIVTTVTIPPKPKAKPKKYSCDQTHAGMPVDEMVQLIKECPPGPWPDGWAGWDNVRDAHLKLIEECIDTTPPYPEGRYAGRGIVVSVNAKPGMSSGKDLKHGYFPGAWCLVKELRRHGCTLPITFTYMGAMEWDPFLTRLVEPLGVQCVDLRECERRDPMRIVAGWESKIYGIFQSPYEETLYLDADNLPLFDPTFLFDCSQYRYYGSIFWPDVPPYDREQWLPECVWKNVGLDYRDEVDFETGQFLVNMKRCWKEMWLARHMNAHSEYYFRFIFGDKSTYHLAWARLGSNWAIPRQGPGGNQASLIQHDFQGRRLFQHNTRNKPSLQGFPSRGSVLPRKECEEHLKELRGLWNGKLWHNIDPTPEEAALRDSLEGSIFTYERKGLDSRPLRLVADNRVGRGAAKMEFSWDVFIDSAGPLLVVKSMEEVPTMILRLVNGTWTGRWFDHERCEVTLTPAKG